MDPSFYGVFMDLSYLKYLDKNELRREAYRLYRSIGYSPKQAAKMRNRSLKRIFADFRKYMSAYNDNRYEYYRGEVKRIEQARPYRPKIHVDKFSISQVEFELAVNYSIPEDIIEQMTDSADAFDLDVYSRRMEGLQEYFDDHPARGMDWDDLMEWLDDISDLGDWLDILGELYDEGG